MEKVTLVFKKNDDMKLALERAKSEGPLGWIFTKAGPNSLSVPLPYLESAIRNFARMGLKINIEVV